MFITYPFENSDDISGKQFWELFGLGVKGRPIYLGTNMNYIKLLWKQSAQKNAWTFKRWCDPSVWDITEQRISGRFMYAN
jgi:hypothetical protein